MHRYSESKVYSYRVHNAFDDCNSDPVPKHVLTQQLLTVRINDIFIQFVSCLSCGTKMQIKNISVS